MEEMRETEKSSLEQHSNNFCRQDPLKKVKISGQNVEKLSICLASKYLPQYIYYSASFLYVHKLFDTHPMGDGA